jgi:Protein of unknown function (DUF3341)
MSKNISVFGLYATEAAVAEGVDQLRLAGFSNTDVSVLFSENSGNKDLAHEKNTKAPEGAVTGAGSGAILGGALGWLAGVGLLAIPGLGPFIAAGPIMGLLSGIGVGGTLGGLTGGLIGAGMPEYEAKRFEGRIRKGGILLSVHCDNADREKSAKRILENSGAQDVASSGEAKADFGSSDHANPRSTTTFSRRRFES